ncbi:MAG: N-glycosylase [Thermoplasmata archaeon]|nr:MAG: N-glycosylase [Thermoplasmata archaeon]
METLKKSEISRTVNNKIKEFKNFNKKSNKELFKELCFCILTANFNAEKSIKMQEELSDCFFTDSKEELSKKLAEYGHRFPNTRAEYIVESRKVKSQLETIIQHYSKKAIREWLVKNVKGLGYKEASHFLRNIGFDDFAIIDFHIVDILESYGLIEKPQFVSKEKYIEIEELLKKIAEHTNLTLAELDLYLWYMETGKILK